MALERHHRLCFILFFIARERATPLHLLCMLPLFFFSSGIIILSMLIHFGSISSIPHYDSIFFFMSFSFIIRSGPRRPSFSFALKSDSRALFFYVVVVLFSLEVSRYETGLFPLFTATEELGMALDFAAKTFCRFDDEREDNRRC